MKEIIENNLKITKVTTLDISHKTDKYFDFVSLIEKHGEMYPNILKWLVNKVEPGIKFSDRIAYIGYNNNIPVISAITKLETDTKFCHLYIDETLQNQNVGDLFFAMMALDVKEKANKIHFTLPEGLWEKKKAFFTSFGFNKVALADTQYRIFEEELKCEAAYSTVMNSVLNKLPKIISTFSKDENELFNGLVMSIKPNFVEKIKLREKVVELRRKFNPKWKGVKVSIYSSHPTKALLGNAIIENIIKDTPENIWMSYSDSLGCSRKEFMSYTQGTNDIYAIFINDFKEYYSPIYLSQLRHLVDKDIQPPQSYSSLEKDEKWIKAVSIAELLHGRFRFNISI